MHHILNSSTGTLVTVAISTAPDGGFRCKSVCLQAKPARIFHNMLRSKVKVQMARRIELHRCIRLMRPAQWISFSLISMQLLKA